MESLVQPPHKWLPLPLSYFDFDIDKCKEYIAMRNPKAEVIPISAKTGEGMKEWTEWLKKHVAEWKQ